MKTTVINARENTRIPFLRGILIRSLLDTGLTFDEAYEFATRIREGLSGQSEVRSEDLRVLVSRLLEKAGCHDALEWYRTPSAAPSRIVVQGADGREGAFSRGKHERFLQASGLKLEKAEQVTALIYDQLLSAGVETISTSELGFLTYLCLRQEVSRKAAERYRVWSEFVQTSRPLIVMICGAVGTGKSTIATEVAHLLDIVRIQSTDMLREVMRMMIPSRLLPVLHTSSFDAWTEMPLQDRQDRSPDQLIADGYRSQVGLLSVACEAVFHRAAEESVPIILEGVHAHPGLLDRAPPDSDAIMVHVTLAVLKPKELKARLRGRGAQVPQRRAKRYLSRFDSIWLLQSFLLSEADRCDVPIITNQDKEKSVQQVILHVNQELAKHFEGAAETVFGPIAAGADSVDDWRSLVEQLGK